MNQEQYSRKKYGFWHKAFVTKVSIVCLVVLGVLLVIDHWNHVVNALPYLLLLSCPLIHLFMHSKHHHDDKEEKNPYKGEHH
ncbi:MAG: DUF2933 domain-containing protein [Alphaproteobacteria bacterium]|nr:DUF2933 domain-containing protein [Alphaproteobacteria bacterium]